MAFYRQSNHLTSSVSVLAITISLVAAQSATQKSLAQFSTTPAAAPATLSINGAGASTLNTLFVGTGTTAPFSPQGSWFNVVGVGNPPSLNDPADGSTIPRQNGPSISNDTFRYASVGSGAGIRAFFTQGVPEELVTVTPSTTPPSQQPIVIIPPKVAIPANNSILAPISFAATDDPLAGTDIDRVATGTPNSGKAIQVPVVGVGIALAFRSTGLNVPAGGLRFTAATYCAILNGNITNWNDARIRADNGGAIIAANLPLRFVRRSDNSGSTFVLSNHLNTVCQTTATRPVPAASVWNRGVGSISTSGTVPPAPPADTVVWPATFLSASGGGGVATTIANTSGAIGYVDSATRLARSLPAALLQNRTGAFVGPTTSGIQHALGSGTIVTYGAAPANRLVRIDGLANPTPATAYPISTASYLLFYDTYANITIARHLKTFIYWALADATQYTTNFPPTPPISGGASNPIPTNPTADAIAIARGYAPLPNNIKLQARTVVNNYLP